jgi:hypothetical protein
MIARRCYRHLDRPFVVLLGLGPLDLFTILIGGGVLMAATNPIVGLVGGIFLGAGIKKLKEGKPRGYVFSLLYRSGLIGCAPAALRPPYLVRPPRWGKSRVLRFSGVPGPEDDETDEARFFRGPRNFLS